MAASAPVERNDDTPAPNPRSRRKSDRRLQLLAPPRSGCSPSAGFWRCGGWKTSRRTAAGVQRPGDLSAFPQQGVASR